MTEETRTDLRKLLVVEDDNVFRDLLTVAFKKAGFVVHAAENGSRALGVLKTVQPDVVLLDMLMPVMDGLRFLYILREEVGSSAPVIVLTCMDSRSLVVDALVAGAHEVLVKPISFDLLRQKVENACEAEVRLA